ncbi:hypothetical protein MMC31_003771 [Peltigera leucophlebia]|nr:hypothetical protein [Peltigera leucophlebia]
MPSYGSPAFQLLGALSNEKQSAIFKIVPPQSPSSQPQAYTISGAPVTQEEDVMIDELPAAAAGGNNIPNGSSAQSDITVGISIEDATIITAQLSALSSTSTSQTNSPSSATSALILSRPAASTSTIPPKVLAQRIIKNAFNFLASFAGTVGAGGEEVVPLRSFRDWWVKFERRIENEPGFLEREGDG